MPRLQMHEFNVPLITV